MLEQSVKLSRLIIFYFISSFIIYAPILPNRSQKPVLFAVFSFLERFFSSSTVVLFAKADVLQTPTIAVLHETGPDPNFAPFRWRIWLALSEFLCLLTNQNVTFVTLFCTKLPFFCTQLPFFLPCYLKTAFLLANHNGEIFSCILLNMELRYILLNTGKDQKDNAWVVVHARLFWITRELRRQISGVC